MDLFRAVAVPQCGAGRPRGAHAVRCGAVLPTAPSERCEKPRAERAELSRAASPAVKKDVSAI